MLELRLANEFFKVSIKNRKFCHFHYYINKQKVYIFHCPSLVFQKCSNYFNLHWYELIEFHLYVFSYCDYNYKYSEGFRRYLKHVPSYLKNKPGNLVLTCLNTFEATKSVDLTGIVQVGSEQFSVISHTDNATWYRVSFGNDENMPYYTCSSWKKSYYPCKHFFTIFLNFLNWSWNVLSPLHVNSPNLQLDICSKKK